MDILENVKKKELQAIKQRPINERKRYDELKKRIKKEFKKLSQNDEFNESIDEIFKANVYYKDSKYLNTELYCDNNDYSEELVSFINRNIEKFNNQYYKDYETYSENDKEFAFFLDSKFQEENFDCVYWCFYIRSYGEHIFIPKQGSCNEMIIIKLNKEKSSEYLDFHGEIHPFIENLKRQLNVRIANRNYDEIYRLAVTNMDTLFYEHMSDFNEISLLKYEGKCNKGVIIYSDEKDDVIWNISLKFDNTIKLNEYKKIRKLLEVSSDTNALLLNKDFEAFAFGSIKSGQDNYEITFIEELSWKVKKNEKDYIELVKLQPVLPSKDRKDKEIIQELNKVFIDNSNVNREKLLNIIKKVKQQKKGTILVISENAEEESIRLNSCGIKVNATEIEDKIVSLVTSIDGALLIDNKGLCYSIGVILDGDEVGEGDSSRGARYNSALRYFRRQQQQNKKCLIVVVSEDGYINYIS